MRALIVIILVVFAAEAALGYWLAGYENVPIWVGVLILGAIVLGIVIISLGHSHHSRALSVQNEDKVLP
jgi:hypothetical protein